MHIDLIHGAIDDWSACTQTHFNFVSTQRLIEHLREPCRYGRWPPSAERRVLTVDDATKAAGHACQVAVSLGHHAILFVNPGDIVAPEPSALTLLDSILDSRPAESIEWDGARFDLTDFWGARRFRRTMKRSLRLLSCAAALETVDSVAGMLRAGTPMVPEHLRTLSGDDVRALRDIGVQIENHGWAHVDVSTMSAEEFASHYHDAASWLRDELSVESSLYAVPFGAYSPVMSALPVPALLGDPNLPRGEVQPQVWNRRDVSDALTERAYPGDARKRIDA